MRKLLSIFVVVAILGTAPIAKAQNQDPIPANKPVQQLPAKDKSLLDVVNTDPRFSTFSRWLKITKLGDYLKAPPVRDNVQIGTEPPLTPGDKVVGAAFVPTDSALAKIPKETIEVWEKDPEQLKKVVKYHLIVGKLAPAEIKDGLKLKTLLGDEIAVSVTTDATKLNDATVDKVGTEAKNGSLYVIDTVLMPPSLKDSGGMKSGPSRR